MSQGRDRILWFTLVAGLTAVVVSGVFSLLAPKPVPLDTLAALPEFTLTRETGEPFGSTALDNQVWIAAFLFTRCEGICPLLAEGLSELQSELADTPVTLVAFSVDPDYDTPAVLSAFGARYAANPQRWVFLTSDRPTLWQLIGDGFLLGVDEGGPESTELIVHSPKFVLVDQKRNIRGYYDGLDATDRARLATDARRLLDAP